MILNFLLFLCTAAAYVRCFRTEEGTWSRKQGIETLRYFTLLSNLFCGLAALAMAIAQLGGSVPHALWLCKYVSVAAVSVTMITVLVFLGPALGYKSQLSGVNLYLHLLGPLLAIGSFCFFERIYPLTLPLSLLGILPVACYGLFYLNKVVLCPEGKRWEDFYGFNKGGKWPVSFVAMHVGAALVCLLLYGLCRL